MRKEILGFICACAVVGTAWGDAPARPKRNFVWVDSRAALEAVRKKDERRYFEILSRYGFDKKADGNPYLSNWPQFPKSDTMKSSWAAPKPPDLTRSNDAVGPASSMSFEAAVIGGTANFLAGRAKEEVLTYAIQRMIEDSASDTAIQLLFPNAYEYLHRLREGGVLYSSDLVLLQKLVQVDLESLPDHLIGDVHRIFPNLKLTRDQEDLFRLGNSVFSSVRSGRELPRILDDLNDAPFDSVGRMRKWTDRVVLVARAFARDTAMSGWIDLPRLDTADTAQRIFAGLLYAEIRSDSSLWVSIVKSAPKSLPLDSLRPVLDLSREVARYFQAMRQIRFTPHNRDSLAVQLHEFDQGLDGILTAWSRSGWGGTSRLDDSTLGLIRQYQRVVERVVARDYQTAVPFFAATVGQTLKVKGIQSRSIMFLTQLPTVQSDTDFEKLLQTYALPVGSSSVKRNSKRDLSLNGYVGVLFGGERIFDQDNWSWATAVAAPVGLSYTTGGKITFFASVVDLGNLVSARLGDRTTSQADLSFQQVLAPGAGVFFDLHESPFSLGVLGEYVPRLRTVEENGLVTNRDVWKAGVVLLVDIPFLTICTDPKR